ncbi:hypothetical protein A176_002318 [Myxococcus hansupus]|uniref:DUF4142 domain-containing protein n=1 Tax=Pseudomyxococcus hansupus TaxID=1297742 RepID=A0A0H4WPH3_9BACT|nr:DUF4142 domain-containing protein [Myxococcus hansupus]AKQ65406.1 hypothetical protein A176_002318 [Myxococcus hansupus]
MRITRTMLGLAMVGTTVMFGGCGEGNAHDNLVGPQEAAAGQPVMLSDGQILSVLLVANAGEVMLGQVGQARATDPTARDFNARMVTMHTEVIQRLEQVAQAQGIAPAENPVSQHLQMTTQRTVELLDAVQGGAFDLSVMDAQVAAHAGTALLGDGLLAQQVQNPALKQELMAIRKTVQMHLQEASNIQVTLYNAYKP